MVILRSNKSSALAGCEIITRPHDPLRVRTNLELVGGNLMTVAVDSSKFAFTIEYCNIATNREADKYNKDGVKRRLITRTREEPGADRPT